MSTGQIARSGKVAGWNVVRSPIQAHLQLVFGTRSNRNGKPQGLEVTGVLIPRMAVASVHALSWRRHAGGFGQRQVSSLSGESDAMSPDRPRTWPNGRAAETAKAPKPPRFRSVKERGLGRANAQGGENRQASAGRWTQLAGAKPDAGASAGDEALATPVARPGSERLDIGRQVWPGAKGCRRFAGRIMSEGHPHAGESGVGSNAGPICIVRRRQIRPLASPFARVAGHQSRAGMAAG
ncbi:hypothetical protein FHS52_001697 [Erythromicrobium ramosum]|uniref:Uncharacterized protein n=1 Tax=Erythrobacter ramosus TaxID=35811 RepID=A0ABR6HYI5_9SPHN|nr:hypothetical protein [Erythrobacter ramosus]